MPEKTDLNISPYYDDFDESKNFHKVLYRAGRPLQARELTQSQSILQNQIERFGNHVFKNGSIVEGVRTDVDLELYYVKVDTQNPNTLGDTDTETYRASSEGKLFRGKTSGVVAKLVNSSAKTTDDELTLFVKYKSSGDANEYKFKPSEELEEVEENAAGVISAVTTNNNYFKVLAEDKTPLGLGSAVSLEEGVVYVRGFFVKVPAQSIILEKYTTKPTFRVGLDIKEELVSNAEDSSLQDNATGTSNQNAAGADRFKVSLTLNKYPVDSDLSTNFVELVRVEAGNIARQVENPMYNVLEQSLARRTGDANGDFVIKNFEYELKEHLNDTTNNGMFLERNGGDANKFVMQMSPGKGYVQGFEVAKTGSETVPIKKARSTKTANNVRTPVRLGNRIRITNVHGLPEINKGIDSSNITPHKVAKLWSVNIDDMSTNNHASNGPRAEDREPTPSDHNSPENIGFCRIRDIEHFTGSSTAGEYNEDTVNYDLSVFDLKMFTKISYSGHSGTAVQGDKITGSATGSTAIVAYDNNSDALYVHDVTGGFNTNDAISSVGKGNFSMTANQNTAVYTWNFEQAGGITQAPTNSSTQHFNANVKKDQSFILTGSISLQHPASGDNVTGIGTLFAREMSIGDIFEHPNDGQQLIVESITSDTAMKVRDASGSITSGNTSTGGTFTNSQVRRFRSQIHDQNQTVSLYAFPRDFIKEHSCDRIRVKRQTIKTISASGDVTIAQTEGEFEAQNTDNFSIAVIDVDAAASPTFNNGDVLDIEQFKDSTPTANGSGESITLSGFGAANEDVSLIITYSMLIDNPSRRDKTIYRGRALKVTGNRNASSAYTGVYGSALQDKDITLGVADVHKIHAIYEGVDGTPQAPNSTLGSETGLFQLHEEIRGQTSDARAILIDYNSGSTSYYYMLSGRFQENEVVIGQTTASQGTLSNVKQGSPNIIDRFEFDDGQRDGYYDISKLVRKQGRPAPSNPIVIIFDYFSHSSGDFFDVNSYSVPYEDIPVYSANRIDLQGFEPDGTYELSDVVDFRPVVGQLYDVDLTTTVNMTSISDISTVIEYSPLSYENGRSFSSSRDKAETNTGTNYTTNPSQTGAPLNGSNVQGDLTFYVPRIDKLFLHKSGKFQIINGTPALTPLPPKGLDGGMELFTLNIPAYTKKPSDVRVVPKDHKRYTMRDIGGIEKRLYNLESVTTLSLLESSARSTQILDADGFDKFKSGFLVDNFRTHLSGDILHPDYNCAMDNVKGHMRPMTMTHTWDLQLKSGFGTNFKKTGDLITLDYTETKFHETTAASRSINVNPFKVNSFIGTCKITPDVDTRRSDTVNVRNNHLAVQSNEQAINNELSRLKQNQVGTVWNEWERSWGGENTEVVIETQPLAQTQGSWTGSAEQGGVWNPGIEITRDITETIEGQTRRGVEFGQTVFQTRNENDKVTSLQLQRKMRRQFINIDVTGLKPNTFHYVFFDDVDVKQFCRAQHTQYSGESTPTTAYNKQLKTNSQGRLRAVFHIPNDSQNFFTVGTKTLKVTSSKYNQSNPASHGQADYTAIGLVTNVQRDIQTTRHARITRTAVGDYREITTRGERINATLSDSEPTGNPFDDLEGKIDDLESQLGEMQGQLDASMLPDDMDDTDVFDFGDFPWNAEDWDFGDFPGGLYFDPLAQSFEVPTTTGGGVFITSAELYFRTKDVAAPVNFEIRTMANGYPTTDVLPLSTVVKNPEDVNVSEDASVKTTFTFDSPIFLQDGREYCFVTYSSADTYEVWYAKGGDKDIRTGNEIGAPADFMGTMFVSQNSSTWNARQEDDIKFKLNKAKFKVSQGASFTLENAPLPWYGIEVDEDGNVLTGDEDLHIKDNPISTVAGSNAITVDHYMHGHYHTSSNVQITGVEGDRVGGVYRISSPTVTGTLPADGTYTIKHGDAVASSGNTSMTAVDSSNVTSDGDTTSSGVAFEITVITTSGVSSISQCKIKQAGSEFSVGDVITATVGSAFSFNVTVEGIGDTLGGIPIRAINTSTNADEAHKSIGSDFTIDTFTVTPNFSAKATADDVTANSDITAVGQNLFPDYVPNYVATDTTRGGGRTVQSSKNFYYDGIRPNVRTIQPENCSMFINVQGTSMHSPEGFIDGTVYTLRTSGDNIVLDENAYFDRPSIVASRVNEQNEMSGSTSFEMDFVIFSSNENLSPVIDTVSMNVMGFGNRLNGMVADNFEPSGFSESIPVSVEPDGESNVHCYLTKKINLKTPATGIRVNYDALRHPGTDLKVLYKVVGTDNATPVDDIGYEFFNGTGAPDTVVDADSKNFKEYEYNVSDLPEFSSLIIKIVGQGYNTSKPPVLSALRVIATT